MVLVLRTAYQYWIMYAYRTCMLMVNARDNATHEVELLMFSFFLVHFVVLFICLHALTCWTLFASYNVVIFVRSIAISTMSTKA